MVLTELCGKYPVECELLYFSREFSLLRIITVGHWQRTGVHSFYPTSFKALGANEVFAKVDSIMRWFDWWYYL